MKTLLRILAVLLLASTLFALVACGSDDEEPTKAPTNSPIDLGTGDTSDGPTEAATGEPTSGGTGDTNIDNVPDPSLTLPTLNALSVPAASALKLSQATAPAEADCQTITLSKGDVFKGDLLLVNALHPLVNDLEGRVNIFSKRGKSADGKNTYGLSSSELELQETALNAFNAMMAKYYDANGNGFVLVSDAYRDEETQGDIFALALKTYGAANVNKYALKANNSDYRTGLAVYLKYLPVDGKTYPLSDEKADAAEQFFNNNAASFGFIQRYPSDKTEFTGIDKNIQPYQYRYVGVPHARVMAEGNYCLEEYIAGIKNYTENNRLKIEDGGHVYHVFYVAAPTDGSVSIRIPKTAYEAKNYSVSGNNVDGFIVTIAVS